MQENTKRTPLFGDVLRLVAPGTQLREGLENVLRAKTGGLIVVGYGPEMKQIVDGGFSINCDFSPAHLYELAKMDGAIIVSEDAKRILYANTQLFPRHPSIPARQGRDIGRRNERPSTPTTWSSPYRNDAMLSRCIKGISAMC